MLKIRYNLTTKILSDWADNKEEFDKLLPRKNEGVALLDIPKPDVDDYEYFALIEGKLAASGKDETRDLEAEIDDIKTRLHILETIGGIE